MKKNKKNKSTPLLRFRPMLIGIILVLMMISGPLILVWKQVYINSASLQMDSMKKELKLLEKEITTLEMSCNRFSSTDRIERIARQKLEMVYPTTNQIYIVHIPSNKKAGVFSTTQDIVAFFRKIITGEKG